MKDIAVVIREAREEALERFARDLPESKQGSAFCLLAETMLMMARPRLGRDYVQTYLEKISGHLDNDDNRAIAADMKLWALRPD